MGQFQEVLFPYNLTQALKHFNTMGNIPNYAHHTDTKKDASFSFPKDI